jgi:iron complex outermembrane receptor protein
MQHNQHTRLRRDLRLGASTAVIAMAMSAMAGQALAAPTATPAATPAASNEVVVTGFRSSLAKGIQIKRVATSEVDTIVAEDIGKFPDLNLAESLQRIPGIAITREGGEGRQISVRGLGPQYTRVRINGMEALSTVGAPDNDGGVNRTRNFDFDVFASDLFSDLTVRKTAEANVDEGSIGATVDLRTARPFDFSGFKFIASVKGDYNDLAKTTGPRASVLLSNTWDDDKIGALVSMAYSGRNYRDTGASTVRWDEGNVLSTGGTSAAPLVGFKSVGATNCQVFPLPAACVAADSALHPRFPRYDYFQDNQTRLGATLSLQYRPNANNLFSLDALHSFFGGKRQEQYLEAPGFSGTGKCSSPTTCTSIANIAVVSDTINSQGVMTGGTFNGVDVRVENRIDYLHTNFDQLTLRGEHEINDKFSVDEMIGTSQSDFENPTQTTIGFDQYNVQNFSYNYANGRIPYLNFGSANVGVGGPWVLTEVRERPQSAINDYRTAQFNAHYKWSDDLRFEAGINYKEYDFQTTSMRLVNGETVTSSNIYKNLQAIATSTYSSSVNLAGAGLSIPGGSTTSWITPDTGLAPSVLGLNSNAALFALSTTGDLGNNASDRERDLGGFIQADFSADVLGRPLHGNLGVRDVSTKQHSQGYEFVGGVLSAVAADHTYSNVLPALNLDWDPFDKFKIRLGVAKVMARPDLTSLVGSTTLSVSGSNYTVKTGNPNLKPFLANAYDLAFEWYPQNGAIYSLAVFRKDVATFVTTSTVNIPFTGNPFGIPDSAAIAACGSTPGCSPSATWAFSTPANTAGGYVEGIELNVQQPFTFLPGPLRHTGVLANLTLVDSKVSYPAAGGIFVTNQLLGLSKVSANATLYYEDDRWSARVSGAYRSKYLTRVPGQEVGTDADGFDPTFNLDASVQYTVTPHIKLTLEGVNLTDQYENEFNDTGKDLSYYYHHTGREVLFGVRVTY